MESNRIHYSNIDITRVLLSVILVFFHAFAPYGQTWPNPIDENNSFYWWLAKISYNGFLEAFVLISGFCYSLSLSQKPFDVMAKIKRLLVPSVFWSILWLLLFSKVSMTEPIFWYKAISGSGHLWFLPMLFFCFILQHYAIKRATPRTVLFLVFVAIFPFPELPCHFNETLHYVVYFNIGCLLFELQSNNSISCIKCLENKQLVKIAIGGYIIVFILSMLFKYNVIRNYEPSSIIDKAFCFMIENVIRILQVLPMSLLYYHIGIRLSRSPFASLSRYLAKYSFSIYILQEFLLRLLYYHTNWCSIVGPVFYPWLSFVIVLTLSFLFGILLSNNRVTKKLIC